MTKPKLVQHSHRTGGGRRKPGWNNWNKLSQAAYTAARLTVLHVSPDVHTILSWQELSRATKLGWVAAVKYVWKEAQAKI